MSCYESLSFSPTLRCIDAEDDDVNHHTTGIYNKTLKGHGTAIITVGERDIAEYQ